MKMDPDKILIEDYAYTLPSDRIALHPLPQREASKLLVYKSGKIEDDRFYHLPDLIPANSLLILNNTKVIEARLSFQKQSGGWIEVFCLEPYGQSMEAALEQTVSSQWKCLIGGASKWKPGQVMEKEITVDEEVVILQARYIEKLEDRFVIRFDWQPGKIRFAQVLHAAGAVPLPPYIKRSAGATDADRYQTVFGKQKGSVAAPTAALHFSQSVFDALKKKQVQTGFVTLNVGAGTFKPVKSPTIAGHPMHGEDFTITRELIQQVLAAQRVIAVGTTSLRTLESLYWLGVKLLHGQLGQNWILDQWEAYNLPGDVDVRKSLEAILGWMEERGLTGLHCRTSLLIVPGYPFKIPSALVTNFHQPGSTLLLLIAAFVGEDWKKIYQHALENEYRFLSYGDSSLLWRAS